MIPLPVRKRVFLWFNNYVFVCRVKKISEQSAAENAVKMLENDTLEVPSASTEKYRLSAINCNSSGKGNHHVH